MSDNGTSNDGAAPRRSAVVEAALTPAVRRATETRTRPAEDALSGNPVYAIMHGEGAPEEKKRALAAFLTFPGTREESRSRIAALQAYSEHLQAVRERAAREIIALTDTETFSEMQAVYGQMNENLLAFNEEIKPLTDVLDAVYALRTNGKVMDAFAEIRDDKRREEERAAELERKRGELNDLERRVATMRARREELSRERSWFGFGGITASAREDLARLDVRETEEAARLTTLYGELKALERPAEETSALGDLAGAKAELRKLLDLTSDEWKARQVRVVRAAQTYIDSTKERLGSVRGHLGELDTQLDRVYDANSRMTTAYAVLGDGLRDAEAANGTIREGLKPREGESAIEALERTQREEALLDHVAVLQAAAGENTATYGDMLTQTTRVRNMKEATRTQGDRARVLHTRGVAGVADRLSTVLNAVSGAALAESAAASRENLLAMTGSTNEIAAKEAIRVAMGGAEMNDDLRQMIEMLADSSEILRSQRELMAQNTADLRANVEEVRHVADEVRASIHDSAAVAADAQRGGA